jgi:hypothetical protein
MIKKLVKEKVSMKGVYTITKAFLETPEQFALDATIKTLKDLGHEYMHLVKLLNSICRTEKMVIENILPTVGRTMVANNLTNASPTNVMKVTHCALGSSGTAVANADVQLGTETYRNAIASITNASNIAYATGFFTATETTGTYAEAGIFSNGTGSANSGILLSHVLVSITKTSTETLTLDWSLTIS